LGRLDVAEVLARHPAGRAVPAHAVLIPAPPQRPCSRGVEILKPLAREAIVADVADGSLDPRLVLGSAHARGIDEEATRLRIFAEALDDLRLESIRPGDDRLHVVDDHDAEDPAVERPGGL